MSKKFTTQQKLMQATQYGIRVYAQQRGNGNDSERLKLEKIGDWRNLCQVIRNFLRKLCFRGFGDMPVKCNIRMEKRNKNGSKKYWIWCMKSRINSLDQYSQAAKKEKPQDILSKLKGMKEKSQPHVIEAMTFLFPR